MITYSVLGKSWRCRKCQKGYYRFGQVLGHDRGFLVATKFLVLCRDRGSLCQDMVLSLQQFLGRDIVFPCHNSALLLSIMTML